MKVVKKEELKDGVGVKVSATILRQPGGRSLLRSPPMLRINVRIADLSVPEDKRVLGEDFFVIVDEVDEDAGVELEITP